MLNDIKKDTVNRASRLGDYQSLDVNTLANGYCDATDNGDDLLRDAYMAALILRFWYKIGEMYEKVKAIGVYEKEDLYITLYECIDNACTYRKWRTDDKLNAQQCIQQSIGTRGAPAIIYDYNSDKNRANVNTYSFDAPIGDSDDTYMDVTIIDGENSVETRSYSAFDAEELIQSYINRKKLIEAIFLDNVCTQDPFRETKETIKMVDEETGESYKQTNTHHEFWEYRLIQILGDLDENYVNYFIHRYKVVVPEFNAAFEAIKKANNQKLYKYWRALKTQAAPEIANYLKG